MGGEEVEIDEDEENNSASKLGTITWSGVAFCCAPQFSSGRSVA